MKIDFRFALILLISQLAFAPADSFAGGKVGGGGDVRRLFAQLAIDDAIRSSELLLDPHCRVDAVALARKESSEAGDAIAKAMKTLPSFVASLRGSKITWTDRPTGKCLEPYSESGRLILDYSYLRCRFAGSDWTDIDIIFFEPNFKDLLAIYNPGIAFPKDSLTFFANYGRAAQAICGETFPMNKEKREKPFSPTSDGFEEARDLALTYLKNYSASQLHDPWAAEQIERNYPALKRDLEQTRFDFRNEADPACAFTEFSPESPIVFKVQGCGAIRKYYAAAWLLLHEMAHHLGIEDEIKADRIATEVLLGAGVTLGQFFFE